MRILQLYGRCLYIFIILFLHIPLPFATAADDTQNAEGISQWLNTIEPQWGGHLKLIGTGAWPPAESYDYQLGDKEPRYDAQGDFRLKNTVVWSKTVYTDVHYELLYTGGDSRQFYTRVLSTTPGLNVGSSVPGTPLNDDLRLLNLTHPLYEEDRNLLYHRLDRLSVSYQPDWGTVRIGRQAVTWGNGFVFNPMDLFNRTFDTFF